MPNDKLEAHEATFRERAKILFEKIWNLKQGTFLEVAKLLKELHWVL